MPEDLWARSGMCPAERAVMLAATSKRVRGLLAGMQRRLPAAVRMRGDVSMEAGAGGLPRLLAWCSVVRLDASWLRMGAGGARMLAGVLGQCSSLATLDLEGNFIGDEGARSLAGVLGQCSSLAMLNLDDNRIHDHVIALVQGCIPSTACLTAWEQGFGEPEDDE